jgi:uncharacterized protein (DUF2062 family)
MSPLLGIHTILGLAVASLFRLNKFVTIVGVYITNPWTIVPIYTFSTYIGARLLGIKKIMPNIDWHNLSLIKIFSELSELLIPFLVGTTFMGILSGLLSYVIVYHAIKKTRQK